MIDAIEFTLDDGTTVAIASAPQSGSRQVGIGDRLQAAEKTLRESLKPITAAAEQAMDTFRAMARRPEEVEIAFGVTFDSKLGGIIAAANAGAQLQVTLRWRGSAASPAADNLEELWVFGYSPPCQAGLIPLPRRLARSTQVTR